MSRALPILIGMAILTFGLAAIAAAVAAQGV